jgi:2-polyprenyl-3-methyl-5-hydroxy-6-metoxy-1,4-benzoquinol methylase
MSRQSPLADEVAYDPDQVPAGRRRALLERTPLGASVLDVGCWSGFVGRFLRDERGATVDGIEPHAEMARRAATAYRRVLPMPVESALESLSQQVERYDTIVLFDVLEHLADPAEVLRALHLVAAPGARVLVSIPNVAHWSVRKQLLLGRFEYEDSGILDRTHLRFFTLTTARGLLEGAGWRVTFETASLDRPPIVRLGARGMRVLDRWPGLFGVQGLFEAQSSASR